ncbi:hypothetical protein FNV43_RR20693 [Rhamnella rubrinervis]|uniref:Transmembrane protein n=1 Tax=Rhamnella rubrinervis TaxID=2594499 RepID=A0A8K0GQQ1_9ROSA|nr:hypothetical protein FNV43_RR20693 [Rhamnella rubrinervis]
MATTSTTMPDQQQQPIGNTLASNPEAVPSSSSWHSSSGSIGPCFAVISVIALLAVLSCVFGRIFSRRRATLVTPLESIKGRPGCSCFGWVMRKFIRRFVPGDVEVASNKVMVLRDEKNDAKARDVGVPHPDPQP